MFKIGVLAPDLDHQIELLKAFPQIVEKHFVPAFKRDAKAIEGRIRPTIPVLSGRAQRAFRSSVTGKGVNLTAQIGWAGGKKYPWYINIVEHGAIAHPLNKDVSIRGSKRKTALFNAHISNPNRSHVEGVHVKIGDRWVTMESHPGISARGFMAAGRSAMTSLVETDMAQANEAVVKELAITS